MPHDIDPYYVENLTPPAGLSVAAQCTWIRANIEQIALRLQRWGVSDAPLYEAADFVARRYGKTSWKSL